MIAAFEWDKLRRGNQSCEQAPFAKGNHCITLGMQDESGNAYLARELRNIKIIRCRLHLCRNLWRRRDVLQIIEPLDLFWASLGDKQRRVHLAERRVVLPP